MNDALKGFRTLIITVLAVLVGNIELVSGVVQEIVSIVNIQLSEGGAIATLVTAAVAIKQLITDAIPRLQGMPRD